MAKNLSNSVGLSALRPRDPLSGAMDATAKVVEKLQQSRTDRSIRPFFYAAILASSLILAPTASARPELGYAHPKSTRVLPYFKSSNLLLQTEKESKFFLEPTAESAESAVIRRRIRVANLLLLSWAYRTSPQFLQTGRSKTMSANPDEFIIENLRADRIRSRSAKPSSEFKTTLDPVHSKKLWVILNARPDSKRHNPALVSNSHLIYPQDLYASGDPRLKSFAAFHSTYDEILSSQRAAGRLSAIHPFSRSASSALFANTSVNAEATSAFSVFSTNSNSSSSSFFDSDSSGSSRQSSHSSSESRFNSSASDSPFFPSTRLLPPDNYSDSDASVISPPPPDSSHLRAHRSRSAAIPPARLQAVQTVTPVPTENFHLLENVPSAPIPIRAHDSKPAQSPAPAATIIVLEKDAPVPSSVRGHNPVPIERPAPLEAARAWMAGVLNQVSRASSAPKPPTS